MTLSLAIIAFAFAVRFQNAGAALSGNESFTILGRSLNITYDDLPLVGILYLVTCLWISATFFYFPNEFFPVFCVIYTALSIASLSIDPFLYSVLILFLANIIYLPVLSLSKFTQIKGRMRFLVFQMLSVFLILLAGWILAGGEIAPVEEDQLFLSSILLGVGIALWLGVFPFHTWIPLLAEEVSFFPFGFLMTLLPVSGIIMLLKFLNNFAWLREYAAIYPALQYLGAIMIFIGGIGAFFQKSITRMSAYTFIFGIGLLLCSVGFIPLASTDLVSTWLIPIILAFWAISVAYQEMIGYEKGQTIEFLKGKFYEKPLHSILFLAGFCTLIGIPFSSGYPSVILLFTTARKLNSLLLFFIISGEIFVVLATIRLLLRLTFHSEQKLVIPDKINIDQIMLILVILLNIVLGLFPSVFYEPFITSISKIFPLI
ncbi:MAG: hypothetical protein GYA51_18125 [Candidatus Methanofastidiosa archaeon]|nr:hypothetical protein [Candidatus Methanofastidiosa archaeon]